MRNAAVSLSLACLALALPGCAHLSSDSSGTATRSQNPSGTGPDTDTLESAILQTITLVKSNSSPTRLARHGLELPTWSTQSISTFEYQLPADCGGYRFRVMETDGDRILEYRYEMEGGEAVVIRDYVEGANPFIGPGLWSSFDHIEEEIPAMMSQLVWTSSSLFPRVYSRGRVTTLPAQAKDDLSEIYGRAVRAAAGCPA